MFTIKSSLNWDEWVNTGGEIFIQNLAEISFFQPKICLPGFLFVWQKPLRSERAQLLMATFSTLAQWGPGCLDLTKMHLSIIAPFLGTSDGG